MRARRAAALIPPLIRTVLLALPLACRSHASPDECKATIEHYLDLALAESPGAAHLSPRQAMAVREVERGLKRAEASYRRVEDDCAAITSAEVACARAAPSTAAWESCVHSDDAR